MSTAAQTPTPSAPTFELPKDWQLTPVGVSAKRVDWSVDFLGIRDIWRQFTGKGVKVCVGDTGVDATHPDIKSAIKDAKDFTRSLSGTKDRAGHGTFCISQICANGKEDAAVSLRGLMPDCEMYSAKCLGDNGSGTEEQILAAVEYADAVDVDILSMSLGGPTMSESVHEAIIKFKMRRKGRFFVGASGNNGRNRADYPARWGIAVGALDHNGKPTSFSNFGDMVHVFAPGFEILGCVPVSMGSYAMMSGTSQATPLVAGVLGLGIQKHRELGGATSLDTEEEAIATLKKTNVNKGEYGIIDAAKLIGSIEADKPPLPPLPPSVPPALGEGIWVWIPGGQVKAAMAGAMAGGTT